MKKLCASKPKELSKESYILLHEALKHLSEKQQLAIHFRFWENMTILEISNFFGLSWDTTNDLIDDAISHLRFRLLNPDDPALQQDVLQTEARAA